MASLRCYSAAITSESRGGESSSDWSKPRDVAPICSMTNRASQATTNNRTITRQDRKPSRSLPDNSLIKPKGVVMNKRELLDLVDKGSLKDKPPVFDIGDTVDVHTKILEGEKERIQVFTGTVIARAGSAMNETFTVRRIVAGEGVERKFPLHSPRVDKVVVKRSSVVRRAKLYFLRDRVGKAVRLKERRRT
jgi:large subunit ribosomal protein L19